MAFRLTGSPDVYRREEREAEQSINFVTCHDGFTLNDLVLSTPAGRTEGEP
jgi:glycogen operon protein